MNDIKFNNSTPSKMFWGASEINAAYYGNEKIYPFETPQVDDWDMLAVYNVTDITDSTQLLGDSGYLQSKIWIDDEEKHLTSAYLFSTLGEHTVKYKFDVDEYQKTSLSSRFSYVPNLISLTFNSNVANVILTSCDRVFFKCTNLTTINGLEYLNTSNVTSLANMFNDCAALTSISGVENWNTSSVTNMNGLFNGCTSLSDISPLANWLTSSLTSLSTTFYGCQQLTSISSIENWDVTLVTDMYGLFYGCSSLTSIDLSNWSASNVVLNYMFADCTALTEVIMKKPITPSQTYNMFSGISTNGTFKYNSEYDYSKLIAALPSTWVAEELPPRE